MTKPDIFAVVWNDFIPLSLQYPSAQEAIDAARAMRTKAASNGLNVAKMDFQPVHVPAGTDSLIYLDRA